MTTIYADGFKARPYWWEAAAPTTEGSVPLPDETDVAIVGAGYAGLSAALELARNGTRVSVLEKLDFGSGASTLSGGAVSSGISIGRGLSGSRNQADEFLRGASESFDHVDAIIAREGIACNWEKTGRFVGAYTSRHYANLSAMADNLNRTSAAGARKVPRSEQRQEIDSDFYRGGLVIERSGKLHPALYHRGLLEAARRAGAMLTAGAHVTHYDRDSNRFVLHTSAGKLRAREVAICTNGYTEASTPELRRRIIPVASHIIATEPLAPDLAASLFPNRRTMSETKRVLCYYRLAPDGSRLVFGGRARFTRGTPTTIAPILHRFMSERLPQLSGTRITHCWTGNVAFSFDFIPHMGMMNGMHYAVGCNGSGVAMMSYLGHAIARKILSGGNRACPFDREEFPGQFGYTGTPWFLPIVGAYYRARDAYDRLRDPQAPA